MCDSCYVTVGETGTTDAFKIFVDSEYKMVVCNYEQVSSKTTGNTKEDRGTCSMVPLGGPVSGQMSFKWFGRGCKEEFLLGGRTTP